MKKLTIAAAVTVASLGVAVAPARATFIIDQSCGQASCAAGTKFFIGSANKNVSSFTGNVGGQGSGPSVTVSTIGNVDTGAGFATIKPVKGGTLTSLTFTPASNTLFDDFSFRGQLAPAGFNGTIDVSATDQNGKVSSLVFTGVPGPNSDFGRLGIVALTGSGETLSSVTVSTTGGGSFKEFKQIEFSFAVTPPPVPEPASLALFGTGLAGLTIAGLRRKRTR